MFFVALPGLQKTGLEKVAHGSTKTSEWVHPSVAELLRKDGPAIFEKGALKAADVAAVATAAIARETNQREGREGSNSRWIGATAVRGGEGEARGRDEYSRAGRPVNKNVVMGTLRLLEDQIMAMAEEGGYAGGAA